VKRVTCNAKRLTIRYARYALHDPASRPLPYTHGGAHAAGT